MAKKITWWEAAEIIGVTDRTMRQWRERLEQEPSFRWCTGLPAQTTYRLRCPGCRKGVRNGSRLFPGNIAKGIPVGPWSLLCCKMRRSEFVRGNRAVS